MAKMGCCKVDHLVVDSGAFIRNIDIKDIGKKIYCIREVVNEIRDKVTRQRLQVLPYDITFREPTPEAYRAVVEFSKKTGDFVSLSAVDLRVLALAYQLEKENVGTEHIRHDPARKVEVWQTNRNFDNPAQIAGFYLGPKKTSQKSSKSETLSVTSSEVGQSEGDHDENSKEMVADDKKPETELCTKEYEVDDDKTKPDGDENEEIDAVENKQENYEGQNEDRDENEDDEVEENKGEDNVKNKDNESDDNESDANNQDDGKDKNKDDDKENNQDDSEHKSQDDCHGNIQDDRENAEEDEESDDGGGWVTPDNIAAVLMESNLLDVKPAQVVPVACLTTDFAMQNVLLQMGLNVLSVDGMLIKRAKSYVLRCYGCFKVVTDMTKGVCPRCGYSTLRKVSMTVNDDGSVQYYLSNRKPVRTRALQHPLPMPKGGKHTNNQQSKHSQAKYDVFKLDNITLDSPFATNSFSRRSANSHSKGQNRSHRK